MINPTEVMLEMENKCHGPSNTAQSYTGNAGEGKQMSRIDGFLVFIIKPGKNGNVQENHPLKCLSL